mgnify:CR=1 FL=1
MAYLIIGKNKIMGSSVSTDDNVVTVIDDTCTDEQVPSALATKAYVDSKDTGKDYVEITQAEYDLLTDEEKEEHPEWECILECKLPEDGQRILVSINLKGHEEVQYDEFYSDDGSYLDSGYEIGSEAVAWMPLPKPYREE